MPITAETNFERLFEYASECLQNQHYMGAPFVNEIHNVTELFELYRNSAKSIYDQSDFYDIPPKIACFQQQIVMNLGYYTLKWDIEKALQIIKRRHIQVRNLPLAKIHFNLPQTPVQPFVKINPIIITEFEPYEMTNKPYLCIDGNHRMTYASHLGMESIPAYVLKPNYSMSCMIHNHYRVSYKIAVNMSRILVYSIGKIHESQFQLYDL